MAFENLIGKTVDAVYINKQRDQMVFVFADGTQQGYYTDGDCCSCSWIEHVSNAEAIKLQKILKVEEIELPEDFAKCGLDHGPEYKDCIAKYGFKIQTVVGELLLEMRNSSNGYYGGYIQEYNCNLESGDWAALQDC